MIWMSFQGISHDCSRPALPARAAAPSWPAARRRRCQTNAPTTMATISPTATGGTMMAARFMELWLLLVLLGAGAGAGGSANAEAVSSAMARAEPNSNQRGEQAVNVMLLIVALPQEKVTTAGKVSERRRRQRGVRAVTRRRAQHRPAPLPPPPPGQHPETRMPWRGLTTVIGEGLDDGGRLCEIGVSLAVLRGRHRHLS